MSRPLDHHFGCQGRSPAALLEKFPLGRSFQISPAVNRGVRGITRHLEHIVGLDGDFEFFREVVFDQHREIVFGLVLVGLDFKTAADHQREQRIPCFTWSLPGARDARASGARRHQNHRKEQQTPSRSQRGAHEGSPAVWAQGLVIEINSERSPPVEVSFTTPTPGAYHLFSCPDSRSDHSLVFTQFWKVPPGTVTVSPTAMICPMSSATPRPYSWRYGSPGLGFAGMRIPG